MDLSLCRFPGLDEPPYDEHGCATFNICPCCGTEFGYDDATTTHARLRDMWVANGMKWWSAKSKAPLNWNPRRQLQEGA